MTGAASHQRLSKLELEAHTCQIPLATVALQFCSLCVSLSPAFAFILPLSPFSTGSGPSSNPHTRGRLGTTLETWSTLSIRRPGWSALIVTRSCSPPTSHNHNSSHNNCWHSGRWIHALRLGPWLVLAVVGDQILSIWEPRVRRQPPPPVDDRPEVRSHHM